MLCSPFLEENKISNLISYLLLVILLFLFEGVSSSSVCLRNAALFNCGTPKAFHITILVYHCLLFSFLVMIIVLFQNSQRIAVGKNGAPLLIRVGGRYRGN